MATQLSAITMIGTTGQAYTDGMRFIQFYFGLPLAMIILSWTLVPFFYNSRVYTAYEYLEQRFDAKTRSVTSLLFLLSRGLVGGRGRVGAGGRAVARAWLEPDRHVARDHHAGGGLHDVRRRPGRHVDRREDDDAHRRRPVRDHRHGRCSVCRTASASATVWRSRRRRAGCAALISRSTSSNQYTFWSGTIAALFLFCSYFGADQSQVQRYLTARSLDEARQSLLMSAYWKIPLQVIVLLVGVLVFVFYTFNPGPLIFSTAAETAAAQRARRRRRIVRSKSEFNTAFTRAPSGRASTSPAPATRTTPRAYRPRRSEMREPGVGLQDVRARATGSCARPKATRALPMSTTSFPTFILTQSADRAHRPADRRHPHGGHRHHRRRAQLALDGDGDRLLQALVAADGDRRALPDASPRSRPASGGCSRAALRSGRPSSARSSRWSTASDRSSTDRFSASSSSPSGFPRATANGAFFGLHRRDGVSGLGSDVHRTSRFSGTT